MAEVEDAEAGENGENEHQDDLCDKAIDLLANQGQAKCELKDDGMDAVEDDGFFLDDAA